ncbi:DNA polymerase III subunit delta' [Loigolactobacillus backii]|uniref:DNA polymerase III subunit delta' n=1 Tax=Loigolactobacillus TaxID=2767889 RepID=UPI0007F109C4|nr:MULTISPECIES: DNA polymerase III subunit delta' [Loigolactobacillus]ANK59114.1 DNA polymerase III subunit delta' [Loigolactobacillus backii]ANK64103.1 DNA polymerase III subunit delta' [Loigolactobacillus backii]ANK67503.1 DNA polymerase III subunit delta' [Loigolactobacillus backii]OLF69754.1 DNA polymerase III subunit delta' [Loigolactobacillus backii]PIO88228.1 DNA polymerase III subunit delta' [Loigolactobacillus backii]
MTFTIETLQGRLVELFRRIIGQGQLSQGYLFAGDTGTGKMELAQWIALRLFCQHVDAAGNPDGTCSECQRILSGNHPDVVVVAPEGQTIKVDEIRFLKSELSKRGMETNQRVFIIQDADKMTTGAANGLLKFLEEPAPQTYLILTTSAKNQLLPTVLSRLQIIDFQDLPRPELLKRLQAQEISANDAALLAHMTNSVTVASELAASDWFNPLKERLWQWLTHVQQHNGQAFVAVQTQIVPLVKDKIAQGQALAVILLLYQDILAVHFDQRGDLSFPQAEKTLTSWAENTTVAKLLQQMEAVLQAQRYLNANVSFQNTLEDLTLKLL